MVHRIAIVRDAPPTLNIDRPTRASTEIAVGDADGIPPIRVALSARDDYGLSGVIGRATLATGSGEQVEFRETPVTLAPVTDGAEARVDTEIDLAGLGMTPGSELYLFFEASDTRPDPPNVTASSTYVFRWPTDEDGPRLTVEGRAIDVPPEYFRSQRQIIIDTEALISERSGLAELEFANRAQALAFDQKALRLRYGQFLGEEDESSIGPMPTGAGENPGHEDHEDHEDHEEHEGHDGDHEKAADAGIGAGHYEGDGHDHGGDLPADGSGFGDADAAIAPFAHFHDREEQSTLFDPETTVLLRRALAAMWDSEGELRMRRPDDALPHQYRALAFIKRVQQASRIYVARVGFRPTPVDEGRRLTGELDEIATGPAPLAAADAQRDAAVESAIRSVSATTAIPSAADAAALRRWLDNGLTDARTASDGDREEGFQRAIQALLGRAGRRAGAAPDRAGSVRPAAAVGVGEMISAWLASLADGGAAMTIALVASLAATAFAALAAARRRASAGRRGLVVALSAGAWIALWLTVVPPKVAVPAGEAVLITPGAAASDVASAGALTDVFVLDEVLADAELADAVRARAGASAAALTEIVTLPDDIALHRGPPRRLRIAGAGLTHAQWRASAFAGRVDWVTEPDAATLRDVGWPRRVAPGETAHVVLRTAGQGAGAFTLLDPFGAVLAESAPADGVTGLRRTPAVADRGRAAGSGACADAPVGSVV